MRKCFNCPNEFSTTIKTRNKKYCDICRILIQKQQKSTRKDFDLFCLDCNVSLPIGSKADKMFCSICARKRVKIQHNNHYINRKNKQKLNTFYKNLQFNFIQSPYLIDMKTLNHIVMVENR